MSATLCLEGSIAKHSPLPLSHILSATSYAMVPESWEGVLDILVLSTPLSLSTLIWDSVSSVVTLVRYFVTAMRKWLIHNSRECAQGLIHAGQAQYYPSIFQPTQLSWKCCGNRKGSSCDHSTTLRGWLVTTCLRPPENSGLLWKHLGL